jgi:hypothetical protein
MAGQMNALLNDIYKALGLRARLTAPIVGRFLHFTLSREERRLADNWSYEPETFIEKFQPSIAVQTAVEEFISLKTIRHPEVGKKQLQPGMAASQNFQDQWEIYAAASKTETGATTEATNP